MFIDLDAEFHVLQLLFKDFLPEIIRGAGNCDSLILYVSLFTHEQFTTSHIISMNEERLIKAAAFFVTRFIALQDFLNNLYYIYVGVVYTFKAEIHYAVLAKCQYFPSAE